MAIQWKKASAAAGRRFRSYRLLAVGVLLLWVAVFSSACYVDGAFFAGPAEEGTFNKTLTVGTPVQLSVTTGSGYIRLAPGAGRELRIHARVRVNAPDRREAQDTLQAIIQDPPVEISGRTVKIGSLEKYHFWRKSIRIDFDIQAPEQTELEVRSGSGDQTVEGIQGPVAAHCGSGQVTIKDIQSDATVRTGSGRITLYRIQGDITVGAGSGDVLAEEVKGSARATTGSGRITLRSVGGAVEVRAGSGDADIRQAAGSISGHTGSGNLRVESALAEGTQWELSAASGTIRLHLPSNSEFALHARTASGMLKSDFPISGRDLSSRKEMNGVVGRPKADLSLRTSSGDIRISKM